MVDNIVGPPSVAAAGVRAQDQTQLSIRMRGSERGRWRGVVGDDGEVDARRDPESFDDALDAPPRRRAAVRAVQAYGGVAKAIRKEADREAEVVIARSASLLAGDLDSVLRRGGQAIRQMAGTLLGIDSKRTGGLVDGFRAAALDWVRDALPRYRSYGRNVDRRPIGLSFEQVKMELSADNGRLSVDVGGVEFRNAFDFRASGVVFDIRASETVREPTPGFYVDTGETGAATAHDIVETVRTDLPSFGISEDTEGVCVLIRAEASDFVTGRSSTWVVDMDVHVPFDPGWSGGRSD
jgi:hypothetical protein